VPEDSAAQQRLLRLLLAELPLKTAVRLAAEISGAPRNTLYEAALALKNQGDSAEPVPAGPSCTMP
jgi:16S rRNA (cytidine1402-2'-O)-methyltransferase